MKEKLSKISLEEKQRRLVESVTLLASDAEVQIGTFPEGVAKADEIALLFDDCFGFVNELVEHGKLTSHQAKVLDDIDGLLNFLSDSVGKGQWTEDALRSNRQWEELRIRAQSLLRILGISLHAPRIDWVSFVE